MFAKNYGVYKERKKLIDELGKNSKYKVEVICPSCNEVRTVTYLSITRAGHHRCISCHHKEKNIIFIPEGTVFGKLTVIQQSDNPRKVRCLCECGAETEKLKYLLKSGHTKSCGCLRKEAFKGMPRPTAEMHWNWRGGIAGKRHADMQTKRYKDWRTSVFERDNFTCLKCGQWGGALNAHHIVSYESCVDKRYEVENGATLCENCHFEFHNLYGRLNVNERKLKRYLSSNSFTRTQKED